MKRFLMPAVVQHGFKVEIPDALGVMAHHARLDVGRAPDIRGVSGLGMD